MTADIYSHAIRGRDHAAAQCWDDLMQRGNSSESPKRRELVNAFPHCGGKFAIRWPTQLESCQMKTQRRSVSFLNLLLAGRV